HDGDHEKDAAGAGGLEHVSQSNTGARAPPDLRYIFCMTRRSLLGSLALAGAAQAQPPARPKTWKPKLGILGQYTEANVAWAKQEGFTSMILGATPRSTLDASAITETQVDQVKTVLATYGMQV